jgi:biopolymer transport protein ExbB
MSLFWQRLLGEIHSTFQAGGWVMVPILLVGAAGFYYLINAYLRVGNDLFRRDFPEFFDALRQKLLADDIKGARLLLRSNPGFVSRELRKILTQKEQQKGNLANVLGERLLEIIQTLDKGMHLAGVMATTAPLLGLLGTVTGMVATFQIITLYGNQNPVLMADGISEALITTQSGLIIAFPLVLLKQRLEERTNRIKQHIEMGAAMIVNNG